MQCPKCNTKMSHEEGVISRESTLNGQRGGIEPVSGHRCWNCGKWVCDAIKIEKPFPGKGQPAISDQKQIDLKFTRTDRLVQKYSKAVMNMVEAGESTAIIAKWLLRLSPGSYCRPETVRVSITRLKMGVLDGIQNIGI